MGSQYLEIRTVSKAQNYYTEKNFHQHKKEQNRRRSISLIACWHQSSSM